MANGLVFFQGRFTEQFSTCVLRKLEATPKEVAFFLNIPYSTYDKYLRGDATFPPDKIIDLYRYTGDIRIINFFVPPGFKLVPTNGTAPSPDVVNNALEFGALFGHYQDNLRKAGEDGRSTGTKPSGSGRSL